MGAHFEVPDNVFIVQIVPVQQCYKYLDCFIWDSATTGLLPEIPALKFIGGHVPFEVPVEFFDQRHPDIEGCSRPQ
jgi:hypothetical protein